MSTKIQPGATPQAPRPEAASRTEATSAPAPAPASAATTAASEPRASRPMDAFSGTGKGLAGTVGKIAHWFDKLIDRPFAMGRDGFVALDPQGRIAGGHPPSVFVRDINAPKTGLDPLMRILADGDVRDVTFRLPGGQTFGARTDGAGFKELPLDELGKAPIADGLDPKKGGLVQLDVSTPKGEGDEARVLALPRDYDGPIFVCDIDSTLRDTHAGDLVKGKTAEPIPGAKELLQEVAAKGVPIVYLSAGFDRLRHANEAFLDQLPQGILLDRSQYGLADLNPHNGQQARRQGLYKADVLAELRGTFPQAKLFGLGDDDYGDAMAYTRLGVQSYIHDVRDGDNNLPADFQGVVTRDYTPDFIARVAADLQRAVETSASHGGTPVPRDWMADVSAQLDRLTGTKATAGNRIDTLVDGEEAFPALLQTIDSAQRSLYYEVFELHAGEKTTEAIADRLIAAHQRGVKVRMVVDALGAGELLGKKNSTLERLRQAGVEVRMYDPIDRVEDFTDLHRNHRKVVVADQATAMVGGMNTGDRYYGPNGEDHLHDAFLKIQGPAVREVAQGFWDSWARSGGSEIPREEREQPTPPPAADGNKVRILTHVPHEDADIRAAYLTLINNAQHHINLENTYPMADDLVDALVAAAQRGVEVRYIVDPGRGPYAIPARKNYQRLLDAGVRIFMYPGDVHTKAISVDGKIATVGSSNVDNLALHRNREMIAVMEDPEYVRRLDAELFERDLVGDPLGRKTLELPKKLDEPFWTKVRNWIIQAAWPDSYE